jgi:hypothetical protein
LELGRKQSEEGIDRNRGISEGSIQEFTGGESGIRT